MAAKNKKRTPAKHQVFRHSNPRKRKHKNNKNNKGFSIVGIGASAGGLEAFKSLLEGLSDDTGMSFVLVQHLDPTHPTALPRLLRGATQMPVIEARNGMSVDPNCVYVIPTNAEMTLKNGAIRITVRTTTELPLPIDGFFLSLAQHKKSNAIGVILSGTGSDGTFGLKAIKSEGGITFAQDEASAKYAGMPQSAEQSGSVDFVLPPGQIAAELVKIGQQQANPPLPIKAVTGDGTVHLLKDIQKILQEASGVNFMNYKPSTIERRIQRRLLLNKIDTLQDYVKFLRQNKSEVDSLYHDIFIHVTNFFRDSKKYEILKSKIFPRLLKDRLADEPLRIWVAGCSSGEEVFSLAIVLLEVLDARDEKRALKIFATDISESEIQRARAGIYPISIKKDVSAQRLKKFFTKREYDYQINKPLREICVFAKHDLTLEPPFSQMDLISCCNVLIYLAEPAQKRVLATFHYSLKQSGILVLGKSETTSNVPNLFEPLDKTYRIYSKRTVPAVQFPFAALVHRDASLGTHAPQKITPAVDWEREADRFVLDKYKHSGFLVDENMHIVAFRGAVTPFLEPARGQASLELTKMVRKDLRADLRILHHKVKRKMTPARKERVTVRLDGESRNINIEEVPIQDPVTDQNVFLILLEDAGTEKILQRPAGIKETLGAKDRIIEQLQRQLAEIKEDMRSGIEDQVQLNEELTTANEELQSANEELQSSSEEHESAREQVESSNEELVTLNEELQTRNVELDQSNTEIREVRDFVQAIVETTLQPLVTLDANLKIKEANLAFYEKFHLSREKVEGACFLDIDKKSWNFPELREGLQMVFDGDSELKRFSIEHDFRRLGHRTILLNARRIIQKGGRDKFILLAMEDITDRKRVEEASATLIKDIHHRVKNNLQVITSLLSLQARFVHDTSTAVEAFKESANRVRSMALIHEKLYESREAGKMRFSDYVEDLSRVLFNFYNVNSKAIQLQLNVEDVYLNMDQAIPCGLIINELLSNSMKHAFPENKVGRISLRLKRVEARKEKKAASIEFSVSDDGMGLPSTIDPDNPTSLGLKIVHSLVGQLNGSLKISRDRETIFQVTFPERREDTPIT